jgi:hypothetical protein
MYIPTNQFSFFKSVGSYYGKYFSTKGDISWHYLGKKWKKVGNVKEKEERWKKKRKCAVKRLFKFKIGKNKGKKFAVGAKMTFRQRRKKKKKKIIIIILGNGVYYFQTKI